MYIVFTDFDKVFITWGMAPLIVAVSHIENLSWLTSLIYKYFHVLFIFILSYNVIGEER